MNLTIAAQVVGQRALVGQIVALGEGRSDPPRGAAQIAPAAGAVALLDEIPGIGATEAAVIIAEVGADMTHFPIPAHLAA
jgi:transposase